MKNTKTLITTIVMLGAGALSSIAVAAILGILQAKLRYALYGFSIAILIPVGSVLAGFIAALGYRAGFLKFPYRPSGLIIAGVTAVSVATYFAVHFSAYSFSTIGGRPLASGEPFSKYLDQVIRNTNVIGIGSFGMFGYLLAIRDVIGFAIGGFAVTYPILSFPFCDSCRRFLITTKSTETFSRTMSDLKEKYNAAQGLLSQGNVDEAWRIITGAKKPDSVFKVQLRLMRCEDCSSPYYDLSVAQVRPRKDLEDFHLRGKL